MQEAICEGHQQKDHHGGKHLRLWHSTSSRKALLEETCSSSCGQSHPGVEGQMGQPHSQTTRASPPPRSHRLQVLQDQMLQTSLDVVKDESLI